MKYSGILLGGLFSTLVLFQAEAQTMKPIVGRNTPAHQAALRFMRGINVGNYLEYAAGNPARTVTYTAQDFSLIRSEGFDHVRIPVAWHLYTGSGPNYTLSSTIFSQVDSLVNWAQNQGLSVMIDLHWFDAFIANPTGANLDKFNAIWRQVAEHYANSPSTVAFELLNEPHGTTTTAILNKVYPEALRQIRLTNPNRTVFVGPGEYNSIDELSKMVLPESDTNLIVTVHCYDPYYFTHQGAEWAYPDTRTTGVIYPGPPAVALKPNSTITHSWVIDWFNGYNRLATSSNPSSTFAFRSKLQRAKRWSDTYGRPVHLGEFGCYEKADATSRVNFYREIRQTMDDQGLGWAMWDWKAGFHYIKNGRPDPPEMREAIFPPIVLTTSVKGTVEFDAAMGKTYVVEKASSLAEPVSWAPISTQTLTSPKFIFNDANTDGQTGGYYRVRWVK